MPKLVLVEGLHKYEGINEAKVIADALKIMSKKPGCPLQVSSACASVSKL